MTTKRARGFFVYIAVVNSRVVNIILLLSVATATCLFIYKFRDKSDLDKLREGLKGATRYLPAGTHVVLMNMTGRDDFGNAADYFIAPAGLVPPRHNGTDTLLVLCRQGSHDTAVQRLVQSGPVIWQHADNGYEYLLIHQMREDAGKP